VRLVPPVLLVKLVHKDRQVQPVQPVQPVPLVLLVQLALPVQLVLLAHKGP
jgi:hypothetical protein